MKKIIKNNILGFIFGIILTSCVVYAYSYNAKDISFTPSNNNWKVNNIGDAIDSIKTTNDTTISNLQSEIETKTATIAELSRYSECVSGSVVVNSDATTSEGQVLEDLFSPNMFFTTEPNGNTSYIETELYVKARDASTVHSFAAVSGGAAYGTYTISQHHDISNNSLKIKNFSQVLVGKTMYYMACK